MQNYDFSKIMLPYREAISSAVSKYNLSIKALCKIFPDSVEDSFALLPNLQKHMDETSHRVLLLSHQMLSSAHASAYKSLLERVQANESIWRESISTITASMETLLSTGRDVAIPKSYLKEVDTLCDEAVVFSNIVFGESAKDILPALTADTKKDDRLSPKLIGKITVIILILELLVSAMFSTVNKLSSDKQDNQTNQYHEKTYALELRKTTALENQGEAVVNFVNKGLDFFGDVAKRIQAVQISLVVNLDLSDKAVQESADSAQQVPDTSHK